MGSGTYLSVDYALATDCLPKGKSVAEAFGLWGIAGFLGSAIGPTIGGIMLAFNRQATIEDVDNPEHNEPKNLAGGTEDKYTFLGYALIMICLGIAMNIMVV